ncbi:2Fe-2S iron-sulfur cluster-binding protein [Terrabacter sp. BE26]|uniref:2Fe-2S iron-sulfur cluster-binding protein n=1 Tax=Terrabacter sp. BE26 TaxID=2898152 RepID=UPI0035BE9E23
MTTVEGMGRVDDLHPLQESFGRHHALQCGFCTPGFLMSSYDLLSHEPDVAREDLPAELSGVLCRCTGYRNIIDAVDDVAEAHRDGIPGPGNCAARTLVGRTPAGASGVAGVTGVTAEETSAPDDSSKPQHIELPSGEPTIAIDLTSELTSSPADVARVLGDVRVLARCLPGAELTEDLGDDWYRGRARIALGPVRLSFQGLAQVLGQRADRIVLNAQGKDTGGGSAQAGIVMVATPSGAGTSLHADAKVFLTGRIAGFGRSLAGDVSKRMFEDFARAIDQAAAGAEPEVDARPPSAFALLAAALRARARDSADRVLRALGRRRSKNQ